MAIQPPSDILLDVANAADPVAVRAATARLAALAADPAAANAGFSKALGEAAKGGVNGGGVNKGGGASAGSVGGGSTLTAAPSASPAAPPSAVAGTHRAAAGKPDAYRKFEAVLLQSFVESMLPKESELFGDKESSGVYRSMMAEQLANQIAGAGGIGIAKSLDARHPLQAAHPLPAATPLHAASATPEAGPVSDAPSGPVPQRS